MQIRYLSSVVTANVSDMWHPHVEISVSAQQAATFYKQHSPLPCLFIPGARSMFSADEDEVIQATAQMNEVEFHSPGSTILAISDMQRTQSNRIK